MEPPVSLFSVDNYFNFQISTGYEPSVRVRITSSGLQYQRTSTRVKVSKYADVNSDLEGNAFRGSNRVEHD